LSILFVMLIVSFSVMHCWLSPWKWILWFFSLSQTLRLIFFSLLLSSNQKDFVGAFFFNNFILPFAIRTFVLAQTIEKLCKLSKYLNWCRSRINWSGLCFISLIFILLFNIFNDLNPFFTTLYFSSIIFFLLISFWLFFKFI
jgi:hypothetical protein